MIKIDVRFNLQALQRDLDVIQKRNIPFATATALTNTARDAEQDLRREMRAVFDRPTPWTLNSIFVKPATKQNLEALVGIKTKAQIPNPQINYLDHAVYGGGRLYKRLEVLLEQSRLLPHGMMVVPGAAARLDQYGNISKGQVQQILAATGSYFDPLNNATKRSKRRNSAVQRIFGLARQRGTLKPGVYQRTNAGNVMPLLVFVHPAKYMRRLEVDRVVKRTVAERLPIQFDRAMSQAVASDRGY